jgi:adenine-specific DNA-methyltransferase
MEDVWNANLAEFALRGRDSLDSIQIKSFSREKTGWATQKNTSLLRRIVAASSRPGDLVADFFCGSGTSLVAAAELGRRFIGCDCALPAVELAHARLLEIRVAVPEDMSQATAPGFERCGLGLAERRLWLGEGGAGEHVSRLLRHHGAVPISAAGLHGQRGMVGVLIGPWDAPLGRTAVQAALREAAARELTGLDVLAWSWGFAADEDLSAGTGVELTCLQLRRELLDDRALAREDGGLGERPRFHFEWRGGPEQTVTLVLCGASLRRPERLAPDLRAAVLADWRELVESWSVEFAATGEPLRADQRQHRTRSQRSLVVESAPARLEGVGPWWARVEVVDRLGAAHPLDFTLRGSEGQLEVAQGRPAGL